MPEDSWPETEAEELRRKLAQTRRLLAQERRRMDAHLLSIGSALGRIEQRLTGIEAALTPPPGLMSGLAPAQWLKLLAGLALPLAALLLALSGNIEAARQLLAP